MEDELLDYYSEISNLEDYNEDFNENIHGEGFIDRKFFKKTKSSNEK